LHLPFFLASLALVFFRYPPEFAEAMAGFMVGASKVGFAGGGRFSGFQVVRYGRDVDEATIIGAFAII